MIKITKEKIDQLYNFYEEIDRLQGLANDAINLAKQNKDKSKLQVVRRNGKKDKVLEDLLWQEVWTIGKSSEGYDALKSKYPDAFAKTDAYLAKSRELKKFSVAELGIDTTAIRLTDIIRLVEGIVEFKFNGNKTL